jgi:hypothetical protein
MTINPDGTYTAIVPSGTFTGKITLIDGKLRSMGDHCVLRHKGDDGQTGSELTPAR